MWKHLENKINWLIHEYHKQKHKVIKKQLENQWNKVKAMSAHKANTTNILKKLPRWNVQEVRKDDNLNPTKLLFNTLEDQFNDSEVS